MIFVPASWIASTEPSWTSGEAVEGTVWTTLSWPGAAAAAGVAGERPTTVRAPAVRTARRRRRRGAERWVTGSSGG